MKTPLVRPLWIQRVWPPLPVWRRLDLAVFAVAGYTAVVAAVFHWGHIETPQWSGFTAALNVIVLGVLLAFRNTQAYDRWWEGRKLWGQLINDSRNLMLKVKAHPNLTADDRAAVGGRVAAFAVALKGHLRTDAPPPAHEPLRLAGEVYQHLLEWRRAGKLADTDLLLFDPHARGLMDVSGACERIKNSPVPLSYRALLRHGLVLYLASTPWFIADQMHFWAIPVMALLAYFLLGIELTAEDVEDPFGTDGDDLALAAYCETISRATALPPPPPA
jgi:putative membrane protein